MKTILLAGIVLVLSAILTGCGDDDHHHHDHKPVVTGPGFVAIDDSSDETAPLLTVTYTVPSSPNLFTVDILSDILSDGDIAFDPILNTLTVTTSPSEVFFGEDSFNDHRPEFRAFLTFPLLDGVTGQPKVPDDAVIDSATLEVLVNLVDFNSVIPTFLDLVEYSFRDLSAADFDAPLVTPTSYVAFDFFSSHRDNFVTIVVTPLMQEAQRQKLNDFQVRFGLQALVSSVGSLSTFEKASLSAYPPPRADDKVLLKRETSSTRPLTQEDLASRPR